MCNYPDLTHWGDWQEHKPTPQGHIGSPAMSQSLPAHGSMLIPGSVPQISIILSGNKPWILLPYPTSQSRPRSCSMRLHPHPHPRWCLPGKGLEKENRISLLMGGISWKTHAEMPQAFVSLTVLADSAFLRRVAQEMAQ